MLLPLLAAAVALPGALAATHLTLLTLGALRWRSPRTEGAPPVRFLVLVPARDEEACIGATLTAIERDRRAGDTVLVVADHCRDGTADIARAHGAVVLERRGGEPGRAQARQAGLDHARDLEWDAVVFIDADSLVEPGFLGACERMLSAGDVLQARTAASPGRGLLPRVAAAAVALQGVVLPRARDRLGFAVRLRGCGMVLRRELAGRYRFHAPASEDGVLTTELCLDGIRPRHVDDARVSQKSPATLRAAGVQRVRWEAGRLATARRYLRPLLSCRSRLCLETALHLVTPPFSLAALSLGGGLGLALLAGAGALAAVLGGLLVLLAAVLVVALLIVRAGPTTWLALLVAPWYVLWKLLIQARAVGSVLRGRTSYPPTPRA